MKKAFSPVSVLLMILLAGSLFLQSCQKGSDKLNAGTSDTWSVTENCDLSGSAGPYNITLLDDQNDEYKFSIKGLYEATTLTCICTFSSTNDFQFTAARQAYGPDTEIEITVANVAEDYNSFTFTYGIYDDLSDLLIEECSGTATRS